MNSAKPTMALSIALFWFERGDDAERDADDRQQRDGGQAELKRDRNRG